MYCFFFVGCAALCWEKVCLMATPQEREFENRWNKVLLLQESRGAAVEFKLEDFKRDLCILCSAAALKMLLSVKSVQFRAFVWSSSQPQICYILIISWFAECLWDFDDALALVVRQSLFVAAQVSCCVAFCFCFPWKTMSVCWTLLVLVLAAENRISWLSVQELQFIRFFFFCFCFFPILNLRFKVLAACDSFLCVSSLNRYLAVHGKLV